MSSEVLINNLATCIEVLAMQPGDNSDAIKVMQDAIEHIKRQDQMLLRKMVG